MQYFDYNPGVRYFNPSYRSPISLWQSLISIFHWHAFRTHALSQYGWFESRRQRKSIDDSGPLPWLPYSCGHFLDQIVSTDAHILEIGGGGSTYWWLSRGNTVTTLETDPEWSDKILKECEQFLERLIIHKVKTSEVLHAAQSMNALFDVVVNDGHGDRLVLGQVLKSLLKPSGILVWDNSDREGVNEMLKALHLPSESRLDFFGLGPINAYCWQTTLISLDAFKSEGRTPTFQNIIY